MHFTDVSICVVAQSEIHHNAALVKAMMAFGKISLYNKTEIFLFRLHLQHRRIVISKMVIGPLPQIRMRLCCNLDLVVLYTKLFRFPRPLEFIICAPSGFRFLKTTFFYNNAFSPVFKESLRDIFIRGYIYVNTRFYANQIFCHKAARQSAPQSRNPHCAPALR